MWRAEFTDEQLDDLLEGEIGDTLLDPGGLLERLSKRLMERALEAEMTDHLGYEKGIDPTPDMLRCQVLPDTCP